DIAYSEAVESAPLGVRRAACMRFQPGGGGLMKRVIALLALFAAVAAAQLTTTSIHGIVKDPSGAVIPNAAVKLTDTGTGIERNTVSGPDGAFVFVSLQAATYRVTVTAQGFQASVIDQVKADSGRTTDVAVQLAVGAATQSVEVSA